MNHKYYFLYLLILTIFQQACAKKTSDSVEIGSKTIAKNLLVPWDMVWGPDDHIWFTERPGRVSRVDPETGNVELLIEIQEVHSYGESGLLGLALHPNFTHPDSAFVYLVYTYSTGSKILERLVRYTYNSNDLINPVILLDNIPANSYHDGSRLIITPDRKILMTTGDAGDMPQAQDTSSLAGKILRINLDGSVPADNPFPGKYAWSIGHRNPQGLVLAPNGRIYSSEHGPTTDDELNIIKKGQNYGWPDVNGMCNKTAEQDYCIKYNIIEPIKAWTPTLAVAGIDYFDHSSIPDWKNSIIMATLKEKDIRVLKLNKEGDSIVSEIVILNEQFGRIRDILVSPEGDIYFAISNQDGRGNPKPTDDRIIKISRSGTD